MLLQTNKDIHKKALLTQTHFISFHLIEWCLINIYLMHAIIKTISELTKLMKHPYISGNDWLYSHIRRSQLQKDENKKLINYNNKKFVVRVRSICVSVFFFWKSFEETYFSNLSKIVYKLRYTIPTTTKLKCKSFYSQRKENLYLFLTTKKTLCIRDVLFKITSGLWTLTKGLL